MKRLEKFFLFDEKTNPNEGHDPIDNKTSNRNESRLKGSFSWNKDSETVLRDVDLEFPVGKLTICAGPVAAVSPFTSYI